MLRSKIDLFKHLVSRDMITPGKHSDARIMPFALANGHGRYIAAILIPERELVSVGEQAVSYSRYKFVTASLLKPPHNGRFNFETAALLKIAMLRFQKRNRSLDPDEI